MWVLKYDDIRDIPLISRVNEGEHLAGPCREAVAER